MALRNYDWLRSFHVVVETGNLTEAANRLGLTKGAISYQIRKLEDDLGFALFHRLPRGVELTDHGRELYGVSLRSFTALQREIELLQARAEQTLIIGITSYFASRWLAPRLSEFMEAHPNVRMRLQPLVNTLNLKEEGVDLAVRWGDGYWTDVECQRLFTCPAFPAGNKQSWDLVQTVGFDAAVDSLRLLRDRPASNVWSEWFARAGIERTSGLEPLIILDPNVRVNAMIAGQGIAIQDALISDELNAQKLFQLSPICLNHYGYFLARNEEVGSNPFVDGFAEWMIEMARP